MATNSLSSPPSVADRNVERRLDTVLLTFDPLSVDKATKAVASDAAGGTSVFVGTTRDTFEGKLVTLLEYEAYESMALKEMTKLCERARDKWPDLCAVAVMHRLGRVGVGEASVITAASAPHRKEAIGEFAGLALDSFIAGIFMSILTGILFVCLILGPANILDACHFLIDDLKATIPIWKKEVYEDGSTWKANKEFHHA